MISEECENQPVKSKVSDALPRLVLHEDDILIPALRFIQRLLIQNPKATRAIVQAVVAEGHRFAETFDGQCWKGNLARSELVRRGRLIWQAYGLDALLDTEPALVPSDWLELIVNGLSNANLEEVLSLFMLEGAWHGTISTP
jgi:hypothetical protein